MTKPLAARSRARLRASVRPLREALRLPTTAIAGRLSSATSPITAESRRRVLDRRQLRRILGIAEHQEAGAARGERRHLGFRFGHRADADGLPTAASPREIRQCAQRRRRRTEPVEQAPEGDRPDVLAADQPQPIPPLGNHRAECLRCWFIDWQIRNLDRHEAVMAAHGAFAPLPAKSPGQRRSAALRPGTERRIGLPLGGHQAPVSFDRVCRASRLSTAHRRPRTRRRRRRTSLAAARSASAGPGRAIRPRTPAAAPGCAVGRRRSARRFP